MTEHMTSGHLTSGQTASGPGAGEHGGRLLHVTRRVTWEQAVADGEYRGSTADADLAEVGFVHTSTAGQLPGTLARFYTDVDLSQFVLLVVDVDACEAAGSSVRWEFAAGPGEDFPHVYGPIPASAAVAVLPLGRDADGEAVLPDLSGLGVHVQAPRPAPRP